VALSVRALSAQIIREGLTPAVREYSGAVNQQDGKAKL
jgi:hypothetical protein